jgi:hypothetical protein
VVKKLALTNRHASLIEGVRVRVELENEVAEPFETVIDRIPAGLTLTVQGADLELIPSALRQRTEREASRIVVTVEGVAFWRRARCLDCRDLRRVGIEGAKQTGGPSGPPHLPSGIRPVR